VPVLRAADRAEADNQRALSGTLFIAEMAISEETLKYAAMLPPGFLLDFLPQTAQGLFAGQLARGNSGKVTAQCVPFLAQRLHIQRRHIDGGCQPTGRCFQANEHFVHRVKFNSLLQQTIGFERRRDFTVPGSWPAPDASARAASTQTGDAREGQNSNQLDPVARGSAHQEVLRELLFPGSDVFHLPHLLDQEPQGGATSCDKAGCDGSSSEWQRSPHLTQQSSPASAVGPTSAPVRVATARNYAPCLPQDIDTDSTVRPVEQQILHKRIPALFPAP